jgi:hypothetical protein
MAYGLHPGRAPAGATRHTGHRQVLGAAFEPEPPMSIPYMGPSIAWGVPGVLNLFYKL